jgi:hypothetical protein
MNSKNLSKLTIPCYSGAFWFYNDAAIPSLMFYDILGVEDIICFT